MGNANFPLTPSGSVATGTCITNYGNTNPTATCQAGSWGSVTSPCTVLVCAADYSTHVGYATYNAANAGTTIAGTCIAGYGGSAERACLSNGIWSDSAFSSCTRTHYYTPIVPVC